jgi:hypothetical protein
MATLDAAPADSVRPVRSSCLVTRENVSSCGSISPVSLARAYHKAALKLGSKRSHIQTRYSSLRETLTDFIY